MSNKLTVFLVFVSVLFTSGVDAQPYDVNKTELPKTHSRGSEYMGVDKRGYIYSKGYRVFNLLLFSFTTNWIKVLNSQTGNFTAEEKVNKRAISKRGYRFESFQFIAGKPVYIVTKKGEIEEKFYYAFEIDPNLSLLGNAYRVGKKPSCSGLMVKSSGSFYKGVGVYESKNDRSKTFVSDVSCSDEDSIVLYAIRLNEFNNILNEVEASIPINGAKSKSSFFTYEKQLFYSVSSVSREREDGKLFKKNIIDNALFNISPDGVVTAVDLDLGDSLAAAEVGFVNVDGTGLVIGQIVDAKESAFVGLFSAKIDPKTYQLERVEKHFFKDDFITQFWNEKEIAKAESKNKTPMLLDNFILVDRFDTDDGGAVSLYQKRTVEKRTNHSMTATGFVSAYTTYYYYYSDVVALKTDANAEMVWTNLIPLYNVTIDYDPGPSFVADQKRGETFIIHQASKEAINEINKNTDKNTHLSWRERRSSNVVITKIDQEGNMLASPLKDQDDSKFYFSPASTGVDRKNNVFYSLSTKTRIFGKSKRSVLKTIYY